jgi:hypothetical protein
VEETTDLLLWCECLQKIDNVWLFSWWCFTILEFWTRGNRQNKCFPHHENNQTLSIFCKHSHQSRIMDGHSSNYTHAWNTPRA